MKKNHPLTNFDHIKNMNLKSMAEFMAYVQECSVKEAREWLELENDEWPW
ncbi:hypothetical protein [Cloacibacillus evryensis]|nr:hypothetical protein [Cloacibacillus evryensis]MEA5034200.1 hypothetical protein [Cloacibacillus evryensis]